MFGGPRFFIVASLLLGQREPTDDVDDPEDREADQKDTEDRLEHGTYNSSEWMEIECLNTWNEF